MAKNFGSQIEEQIRSTRSRNAFGRIDGVELIDTYWRIRTLQNSLQALGPLGDSELFRYFPVAAVAALEGHFKETVAAIINSGPIYLERGLSLAKDKLKSAADIVPLLHRKTVTIGAVVAHLIPFNSVSSLENAFDTLLDGSFKNMVATARDPHAERNGLAPFEAIVPSISDLWRALALAFERRHILAHEAATQFELSFEDAKSAVEACTQVTRAIDAVLWATVWKHLPLTQYEMNVAACLQRDTARAALAATLRKAMVVATEDGERATFRKMHRAWKAYNDQWTSWESAQFAMGSMRPMLLAGSQERALVARRESVQNWLNVMRPESLGGTE